MPKEIFKCAYCGKLVKRYRYNPKGIEIQNHFCNNECKGNWQKKQREDLGYNKEWLYEQYIIKGRDCNDIAREVKRDPKRVWEWIKDYGIDTRKRGYGTIDYRFQKGHTLNRGKKLSEETKEKIREARLKDGRVPYLVNGVHWMSAYTDRHPGSWKGGVTPLRQKVYSSKEWKNAVEDVIERENDTCQRCGKKHEKGTRNFDIHHIYSFDEYPYLRTNPDNLVLLCRNCHMFVHSKKNVEFEFMPKPTELSE